MRLTWLGLVLLFALLGNTCSVAPVRAQTPPADYLPTTLLLPHANCFGIDGDGVLDFPALLARFAGVPNAADELTALGWEAGAYRHFGCDNPPVGHAGWIDISVHQFGDAAGATAAIPFFAESRALGTSLQQVSGTTALTGPVGNGIEYTLYVTNDRLLFRVTGVAPAGSPQHDVEQVASALLAGAAAVAGPAKGTTQQVATPRYSVVDLGTGAGNWSSAFGINESGQVLWIWATARESVLEVVTDPHVMVWKEGTTTDLTTIGLAGGIDINNDGIVLGSLGVGQGGLYLPTLPGVIDIPGMWEDAYPAGINDNETITGNVGGRAVLQAGARQGEILPPAGYEYLAPSASNNADQVVGTVRRTRTDDTVQRAVLYETGIVTVLSPAPGALGSWGADISDTGQVIGGPERRGMHSNPMAGHAFLYDHASGVMTDLGVLLGYEHSLAYAVNNVGQVVGISWSPVHRANAVRRAFLYEQRSGTMTDLNQLIDPASGWLLLDAFDINDAGHIVGSGLLGGERHAFVLLPNP